jgi:hypothetical protein
MRVDFINGQNGNKSYKGEKIITTSEQVSASHLQNVEDFYRRADLPSLLEVDDPYFKNLFSEKILLAPQRQEIIREIQEEEIESDNILHQPTVNNKNKKREKQSFILGYAAVVIAISGLFFLIRPFFEKSATKRKGLKNQTYKIKILINKIILFIKSIFKTFNTWLIKIRRVILK